MVLTQICSVSRTQMYESISAILQIPITCFFYYCKIKIDIDFRKSPDSLLTGQRDSGQVQPKFSPSLFLRMIFFIPMVLGLFPFPLTKRMNLKGSNVIFSFMFINFNLYSSSNLSQQVSTWLADTPKHQLLTTIHSK